MIDPNWQKLWLVEVKAQPQGLWGLVTSYLPGSRLLRFTISDTDESANAVASSWKPAAGTACGADGMFSPPSKSGLLSSATAYGALIGKLGGGSADVPDSTTPATPYGTKRVFGVGSHCVILLASTDAGPLYLTMNDAPDGFSGHSGSLHVLVEHYPV